MKRLIYALILLGIGGLFPSVSSADEFDTAVGKLLNNEKHGGGAYLDLRAEKSCVLKLRRGDKITCLDFEIGYTAVQASNFGEQHGWSEQIVRIGFLGELNFENFLKDLKIGGGLLASIHYPWGDHYQGDMGNRTITAECLMCGWYVQASYNFDRFESPMLQNLKLTVRYISTDPNLWTSHNGAMVDVAYRFGSHHNDSDELFGKNEKPLPTAREIPEPPVTPQQEARVNVPVQGCTPPVQLEAENNAGPHHIMGPM